MKKGDLVIKAADGDGLFQLAPKDTWDNPGVVIRGAYEGSTPLVNVISGKSIATEITRVVDIMIMGRVIKGVPTKYLSRVVR